VGFENLFEFGESLPSQRRDERSFSEDMRSVSRVDCCKIDDNRAVPTTTSGKAVDSKIVYEFNATDLWFLK